MRITLSFLVLPSVIARHVQLPLLDEVYRRGAQHFDGGIHDRPITSIAGSATSKLSESWFDQAGDGPKATDKQSKW